MRQLRILAFHVRQFAAVPYFVQLMAFTTLANVLVQLFAYEAWGSVDPVSGWLRAGIIGMWTTSTCSAGIIGFERAKGTLAYLVTAPMDAARALFSVVAAAASFGVLSFPLGWAAWSLLAGAPLAVDASAVGVIALGVALLFLGSLALSFTVASLFVLTPNAISYEGLLLVPIMLLSGVLFSGDSMPDAVRLASRAIPIGFPVDLLYGRAVGWADAAVWLAALAAWTALSLVLVRRALRAARVLATLEVI